ncbi:MAG: hypothetical protein H6839_15425 [Planctomycetes bacterium]|nr:hypothetical protein [Planctomycetota bacterium]
MSQFLSWLNAIGTSQLLLARQYGRFVEEFKRYWDRDELRSNLTAKREEFIAVAKKASRYLVPWARELEDEVLGTLPAGLPDAQRRQLDVALADFRQGVTDCVALSVRRPSWVLTGVPDRHEGLLTQLLQHVPKESRVGVELLFMRHVARLGRPFSALRDQHEANAWIAAEVIEESRQMATATPGRRELLYEWSLQAGQPSLPEPHDDHAWDSLGVLFDGNVCDLGESAERWGHFLVHHLSSITDFFESRQAGAPAHADDGGHMQAAQAQSTAGIRPQHTYTLNQLAELTGWKKSTLRAAAQSGELVSHQATGATNSPYQIKGADFLRWQESRNQARHR